MQKKLWGCQNMFWFVYIFHIWNLLRHQIINDFVESPLKATVSPSVQLIIIPQYSLISVVKIEPRLDIKYRQTYTYLTTSSLLNCGNSTHFNIIIFCFVWTFRESTALVWWHMFKMLTVIFCRIKASIVNSWFFVFQVYSLKWLFFYARWLNFW